MFFFSVRSVSGAERFGCGVFRVRSVWGVCLDVCVNHFSFFADDTPTEAECLETVAHLLSMVQNRELQVQGLQGLSQMAASHPAARAAVAQLAWASLVECAAHEDEEVRRCSITAMADLLSVEPSASFVQIEPQLTARLQRGLQSTVPEIVRQSIRALNNLPHGNGI